MARQGAGVRKYHRPGRRAYLAPQLGVDKVREPSEEHADRRSRHAEVGQGHKREIPHAGEDKQRQAGTDHATMEGHAAPPDGEDFFEVLPIVVWLIKQDVPEPATNNNTDGAIEQEICGEVRREGFVVRRPHAGCSKQPAHVQPTNNEADHVSETIPLDLYGADTQRNRTDFGKVDGKKLEHRRLLTSRPVRRTTQRGTSATTPIVAAVGDTSMTPTCLDQDDARDGIVAS